MSATKKDILDAIEELKKKQPDGWRKDARVLLRMLHDLDDPFREHEYHGSEFAGRHNRQRQIVPQHDKMGDNSWP